MPDFLVQRNHVDQSGSYVRSSWMTDIIFGRRRDRGKGTVTDVVTVTRVNLEYFSVIKTLICTQAIFLITPTLCLKITLQTSHFNIYKLKSMRLQIDQNNFIFIVQRIMVRTLFLIILRKATKTERLPS